MSKYGQSHIGRVIQYFMNKNIGPFSEWLNEEHIEIKVIDKKNGVSSRVLNHWEKMGLIPLSTKRKGHTWRRFNLIELLWLFIILKMRDVGTPLELIKKIKDSINSRDAIDEFISQHLDGAQERINERYLATTNPFLESAIYFMWFQREQVYFFCPFDGEAVPLSVSEFVMRINMEEIKDNTSIYLNPILQAIFPNKDLAPRRVEAAEMRDDIIKLLGLIYSTKATKLEVRMEDGRIKRIDLTHKENMEADISQLLQKAKYQEITLSSEGGKTKRITRIEKIKF